MGQVGENEFLAMDDVDEREAGQGGQIAGGGVAQAGNSWCRPDNALCRRDLSMSLTIQNGLARVFGEVFFGVRRLIEAGRTVKDRG